MRIRRRRSRYSSILLRVSVESSARCFCCEGCNVRVRKGVLAGRKW